MRRALVVALALAGCKAPLYSNGGLLCGAHGDCPQGWHCAFDDTCWRNGQDPTPTGDGDMASAQMPDLAIGGSAVDLSGFMLDMAPLCGWSMPPSNFDPCAAGAPVGNWTATTGTYDTDAAMGAGGPTGTPVQQTGGPMVRVVRVTRFSVPQGVTLTLLGSMPLIIAADDVDVSGSVYAVNGTGGGACSVVVNGIGGARCGSGGAGGAFGASGGAGGACSGTAGPAQPGGIGSVMLTPLIGGCGGGRGGIVGGGAPGMGGSAGGALQISARISLSVTGIISARGGGGGGGVGTLSACGGSTGCATGGGGGGSGGAILLESPMVVIDGHVCANGGGGGGGGGNANTSTAGGGGLGACDDIPSGAGGGLSGGGNGQSGGYASHPAGYDGSATTTVDGGGGGGGSVGRIRIHAGNVSPVSITAVVTPAPYLN